MTTAFIEPDLLDPADLATARPGGLVGLAATRCPTCGRVDFPARDTCSACSAAPEAYSLRSPATLGSRTSVLHPPPGGLVPVPYDIGIAVFPEGIAVLGLLVDGDGAERGCGLEVVAADVDGRLTYAFRPTT